MKKIINGKRYDTETAEELGYWHNGRTNNDFYVCSEALYRKRTGEFFLHAWGGPLTEYCGEDVLIPMSDKEARKWAEKKLDGDAYESIFGEVEEIQMVITLE